VGVITLVRRGVVFLRIVQRRELLLENISFNARTRNHVAGIPTDEPCKLKYPSSCCGTAIINTLRRRDNGLRENTKYIKPFDILLLYLVV
jgi:hypothetical protein